MDPHVGITRRRVREAEIKERLLTPFLTYHSILTIPSSHCISKFILETKEDR